MRNDPTPFIMMMVSVNMMILSLSLLIEDDYEVTVETETVVEEAQKVDYGSSPEYKTLQCIPRKEGNTTICDEWVEVPDDEEEVQY